MGDSIIFHGTTLMSLLWTDHYSWYSDDCAPETMDQPLGLTSSSFLLLPMMGMTRTAQRHWSTPGTLGVVFLGLMFGMLEGPH